MKSKNINGVTINYEFEYNLRDILTYKVPYEDLYADYCIYLIINELNGKAYVGQAVELDQRLRGPFKSHLIDYANMCKTKNHNRVLYNAFRKYKTRNFNLIILEWHNNNNKFDINDRESYWIKLLHTCILDENCHGYNMNWGGDDHSNLWTPEVIQRSVNTRRKKYGCAWANCHTKEALEKGLKTKLEKYGQGWFVNAHTPEANEKRIKTNLELYGTCYGPKMSEEVRDRIRKRNMELYNGDPYGPIHTRARYDNSMINRYIDIINEYAGPSNILTFRDYLRDSMKIMNFY